MDKACRMPLMFSEVDLETMQRLRRALDPAGNFERDANVVDQLGEVERSEVALHGLEVRGAYAVACTAGPFQQLDRDMAREAVHAGAPAYFGLAVRNDKRRVPSFSLHLEEADPATGELCGFSTQMLMQAECQGRPVTALFSGDTIIAREYWGDPALSHAWGRLALQLMDLPGRELYWFLMSKGYKTYRFLPVFFREFDPHPERPMPPDRKAVLDVLARRKYPRDGRSVMPRHSTGGACSGFRWCSAR